VERPSAQLLRWRCRRGMKELDVLLERFLQGRYTQASLRHQQAFERLLGLPDPLLAELLLSPSAAQGDAQVDRELAEVIALVAAPGPR